MDLRIANYFDIAKYLLTSSLLTYYIGLTLEKYLHASVPFGPFLHTAEWQHHHTPFSEVYCLTLCKQTQPLFVEWCSSILERLANRLFSAEMLRFHYMVSLVV